MRVLVIEDRMDQREIMEGIALEVLPRGSTIVGRGTLAAGLAEMAEARFDLILLDIGLPGSYSDIRTYDTVAAQAEEAQTPILVVTGLSDGVLLDALMLRGAVVLPKPFTRADLGGMIRCLTCQHRPRAIDIMTDFRRNLGRLGSAIGPHGHGASA